MGNQLEDRRNRANLYLIVTSKMWTSGLIQGNLPQSSWRYLFKEGVRWLGRKTIWIQATLGKFK